MVEVTRHERLRIGLVFTGSYDWVGGLYYIHNIIRSLNFLPEEKKPFLLIIPEKKTPKEFIDNFCYPYSSFFSPKEHTIFHRIINKGYKILKGKNLYFEWLIKEHNLQWLYPFNDFSTEYHSFNDKKISWIYDFQHKLLPELFSVSALEYRNKTFKEITSFSKSIVVSSHDSKNHLLNYYPDTKASIKVLQFVSIIDEENIPPFEKVQIRYGIKEPYFLVSNQFWQHKNHQVILEALKFSIKANPKVQVVFTGKEYDPRNPDYFNTLTNYVKTNALEKNTRFLGFISREDQLSILKYSLAIIQPSRFEGWGTVVEDAKSLGKPIILSNINVHREQIGEYGYFFEPDDAKKLSELMLDFYRHDFSPRVFIPDQNERLKKFAQDFISIFYS